MRPIPVPRWLHTTTIVFLYVAAALVVLIGAGCSTRPPDETSADASAAGDAGPGEPLLEPCPELIAEACIVQVGPNLGDLRYLEISGAVCLTCRRADDAGVVAPVVGCSLRRDPPEVCVSSCSTCSLPSPESGGAAGDVSRGAP
jgi:hypothetical protein